MSDSSDGVGAPPAQMQIQLTPEIQRGVYANQAYISHTQEEFILDFILATPPGGVVNSRVILSPTHVKRLLAALHDGVAQYEQQFGSIGQVEPLTMPDGVTRH
ncbi:MAG: DUF3467 domain-containing protein [Mariprofundales bacterium]|nr:DUF3467 domain-containing protein [Mariprofundales bacterium]